MRKKALSLWLCAALVAVTSCKGQVRAGDADRQTAADTAAAARELPLPEVPQGLTAPAERAEYILAHFWDTMDFADTLRSHDRLFMEQNLVNFVSLFPHVGPESLPPHIDRLMERAAADTAALRLVGDIAEHYFDDPNSPMRNEDYFIIFLEGLLRQPALPEAERARRALQLEMAEKNRPGAKATDFAYTDRNGNKRTLHGTRGKRVLLLFYDPACSHCTEILDGLRDSELLARLVDEGKLTVLAVYTEGDTKLWRETKDAMPAKWTVGIDGSRIVERGLYILPAMPVIYLLDGSHTVLLKDAPPDEVEHFLERTQ